MTAKQLYEILSKIVADGKEEYPIKINDGINWIELAPYYVVVDDKRKEIRI
jgi:hypothetical protein